jgi:hypothetical protein
LNALIKGSTIDGVVPKVGGDKGDWRIRSYCSKLRNRFLTEEKRRDYKPPRNSPPENNSKNLIVIADFELQNFESRVRENASAHIPQIFVNRSV